MVYQIPKHNESSIYHYSNFIKISIPLSYMDYPFCSLNLVKKDPKIKAQAIKCIDISVFNKTEDGIINVCLDNETYKRKVSYYIKLTKNIIMMNYELFFFDCL